MAVLLLLPFGVPAQASRSPVRDAHNTGWFSSDAWAERLRRSTSIEVHTAAAGHHVTRIVYGSGDSDRRNERDNAEYCADRAVNHKTKRIIAVKCPSGEHFRLREDNAVAQIVNAKRSAEIIQFPGRTLIQPQEYAHIRESGELTGEVRRVGGLDETVPIWLRRSDGEVFIAKLTIAWPRSLAITSIRL